MSLIAQGFHEEEEVGEELMVTTVRRGPQSRSGATAALTQQSSCDNARVEEKQW
jgi:hypothetical protein